MSSSWNDRQRKSTRSTRSKIAERYIDSVMSFIEYRCSSYDTIYNEPCLMIEVYPDEDLSIEGIGVLRGGRIGGDDIGRSFDR